MRLTAIPRRPLVLLSPPTGGSITVDPVRSGVKTGSSPRPRAEPASSPLVENDGARFRRPSSGVSRRAAARGTLPPSTWTRKSGGPAATGPPGGAADEGGRAPSPATGRDRSDGHARHDGDSDGARPFSAGTGRCPTRNGHGGIRRGPRGTAEAGGPGSDGPRTGSAPGVRASGPVGAPGPDEHDRSPATHGGPGTSERGPDGTGPDEEDEKGEGPAFRPAPHPGPSSGAPSRAPDEDLSTCRPCRRHRPEQRASARA